jgi:hypothetical protein
VAQVRAREAAMLTGKFSVMAHDNGPKAAGK